MEIIVPILLIINRKVQLLCQPMGNLFYFKFPVTFIVQGVGTLSKTF